MHNNKVIVIDCNKNDSENPLILADIPNVNGAIYENGNLYVTIDESKNIYLWKNNSLEVFREVGKRGKVDLPIKARDVETVELIFPIKGSDNWTVKVNEYYSVYDPQKNFVMYWLYGAEKIKDYVICKEKRVGLLLETTLNNSYEDDYIVHRWYEMSVFDLKINRVAGYLGYVERTNDWNGRTVTYPTGNNYKWPLIKYTYEFPKLIVCTENPRYVLCSLKNFYFIVDIFTQKLLSVMESELRIGNSNAVFINKELTRLVLALDDKIQTYEITKIPEKELSELNKIYMLLPEELDFECEELNEDHERYIEYHERYETIRDEYGNIKLISENTITIE